VSQSNRFQGALSWSFLANGGKVVTNMVVLAVLSALLGPERMGIVVVANLYIFLIQQTVIQGTIPTIVQRSDLEPDHKHSAFWLVLATAGVFVGISMLIAAPVTGLLSNFVPGNWTDSSIASLTNVIRVLALSLLVRATSILPESLFRRSMDFKTLGIRSNIAAVTAGVAALVAAFLGAGIWSLVVMQLTLVTTEAILLWTATEYRPRLLISWSHARDLLPFYWRNMLAALGEFSNSRVDTFVVAFYFGPQVTGLYRIPSRLIETQMDVAARSLQGVALPELSRLQHDKAQFTERLLELITLSNRLVVPLMGVIAASAHGLLRSLDAFSSALRNLASWLDFSDGEVAWAEGADALEVLCLVGAFQALYYLVAPTLQAFGKPAALAALIWAGAACSAVIFIVTGVIFQESEIANQVLAVAGARALLFGGVLMVLGQAMLYRITGLSPLRVLANIRWLLLAGLSAYVVREAIDLVIDLGTFPPLADLVISMGAGLLTVGFVLLTFDAGSKKGAKSIKSRRSAARTTSV